jgi:hypothetical protein
MRRNGCGDVGERRALPDRSGLHGSERKHRYLLAGVVGTLPSRVAPVIRRDNEEIAGPQRFEEPRQARIECFERRRIARRIAAMTEHRVEIDEIREQQPAVTKLGSAFQGVVE